MQVVRLILDNNCNVYEVITFKMSRGCNRVKAGVRQKIETNTVST